MSKISEDRNAQYLTSGGVAERYGGTTLRTVRRWVAKGVLPRPDLTVNGRGLWRIETLERNDRQRTIDAADRRPVGQFASRRELAAAK